MTDAAAIAVLANDRAGNMDERCCRQYSRHHERDLPTTVGNLQQDIVKTTGR